MLHMAMAHCAEIFTDFYVPHNKYFFFKIRHMWIYVVNGINSMSRSGES